MPQNEGMLFAFEQPAVQCFWMKNTLLPLTAAFVADDGSIVNLADAARQRSQPLLDTAGAFRARDAPGLVRQARGMQAGFRLMGSPFRPQQL